MCFSPKMIHNVSKHVGDRMFQMYKLCTKTLLILLSIIFCQLLHCVNIVKWQLFYKLQCTDFRRLSAWNFMRDRTFWQCCWRRLYCHSLHNANYYCCTTLKMEAQISPKVSLPIFTASYLTIVYFSIKLLTKGLLDRPIDIEIFPLIYLFDFRFIDINCHP